MATYNHDGTVKTYSFTHGSADFQEARKLLLVVGELAPPTKLHRTDKVLWCFGMGLLTIREASLLMAWLRRFQVEEVA